MGPARIYPWRKMHRSRAPSIAPGTFFVAQPWADCITNMPGFNLRQAHGQNETEQPDHSASLGDSITSSTRIRFSVHTGIVPSPKRHPVFSDFDTNSCCQEGYQTRSGYSGRPAFRNPSTRCSMSSARLRTDTRFWVPLMLYLGFRRRTSAASA
jgi:hypothetical protein